MAQHRFCRLKCCAHRAPYVRWHWMLCARTASKAVFCGRGLNALKCCVRGPTTERHHVRLDWMSRARTVSKAGFCGRDLDTRKSSVHTAKWMLASRNYACSFCGAARRYYANVRLQPQAFLANPPWICIESRLKANFDGDNFSRASWNIRGRRGNFCHLPQSKETSKVCPV